ncbi:MAG: YncE family protein [Bacteroidota bacterium]|nr:YncE family protein [Bacteroidota bacterium]
MTKINGRSLQTVRGIVFGALLLGMLVSMACSQETSFNQRAEKLGLKFITDVPMTGGATRFDYQSVNEVNRRLYIAHMGSDRVSVFDMDAGKVIQDIPDMPDVHGVLAVPGLHRVYASTTGKNEVAVIDENTLQKVASVQAGDYPDGLAYAPVQKRVFVSDEHGKTVSVMDAVNNQFLKKIAIGGEVGNTHYDSVSGWIITADQTNNQLVAIDPGRLTIIKRYNLPGCRGAHGFYIDTQTHYALITGEDNASFVALDLTSGVTVAKDQVGRDPDVLAFDIQKHLLFVSSESGNVSVFKVEPNNVRKISQSFFYAGAHTISIDQKKHLLFFPLKNVAGKPVLRVMQIR